MARRLKKKDHENLSDTNIRKVIELLSGQAPISKKEACSILNIAYNTTRLQRIIDDFEERRKRIEQTKESYKTKEKQQQKDEVADAITRFLSGDPLVQRLAADYIVPQGLSKQSSNESEFHKKQEGIYDYLPRKSALLKTLLEWRDSMVGQISRPCYN